MKTLMIISGGDAPGINTLLARYVALAAVKGDVVVGADGGFEGVLNEQFVFLKPDRIVPWAAQPGTLLRTSRQPVLSEPGAGSRLAGVLTRHAIDNLVLFGGDGTLRHIPPLLRDWGIPGVAVPTTIDNDVPGTERTLGFDSACNYAYQAVNGIHATGHALAGRIFMLETLGGYTGFLALAVAFGAGAHAVLVPEYGYADAWLADRLLASLERYGHALLVLSEGVAASRTLADEIPQWTGVRVRDTRLGHAQRGAAPSHADRTLAAHMARTAYHALRAGTDFGTLVVRDNRVQLTRESLAELPPRQPDRALYDLINGEAGNEHSGN